MSNRKAISRKEIDSRWFFCNGWTGGRGPARRHSQANIEGPATRPLTSLANTPAGSFSISPSTSPPSPLAYHSLHSFSLSLSLFRSRFLLHSTAFIIKIKCKIVPRTSFPNGIKLRARFSLSLHYHYTRGRIDPSFLDRVVPSRFIYSSRANERAVFPSRFSV